MKWFTLVLFCIVMSFISAYLIPESFKYSFGYLAGCTGMIITSYDR
ncbi:MAG: hypothetical protein PHT02_00745 [Tissierellia bacterium]|nr:hypothetical protein [Tissierellia bacterium]